MICHKKRPNHIYLKHTPHTHTHIYIYIYKEDLALNNLKWWICHKTKWIQTKNSLGDR